MPGLPEPQMTGGEDRRDGPLVLVPPPLDAGQHERWLAYATGLAKRKDTGETIATVGHGWHQCFLEGSAPENAAQVEAYTGKGVTTDLLNPTRSTWDAPTAAGKCAEDVLSLGPELLVAAPLTTRFDRARDFSIFGTCALFETNHAVPLALRRAYDLNDEDDAMDDLIDVTTRAAINMGCPAPLVTFDLWLADDVINQLASEEYPFVAALAPSWTHQAVRPAIVSLLESGTSPEELFSTDEYEIHRHLHRRHGENGRAIELIPVEFVAQAPTALFIVSVSDEAFPYFLARPMVADDSSAEQRATAAASLVERALAVGPVNPLQSLGLERFKAGENGTERWQRMMTVVQAYVTFHYLDIQKQKTGAP